MTRYTKLGRKRHLDATKFTARPLIPAKLKTTANKLDTAANDVHGTNTSDRRQRRAKQKQMNTICFGCRATGHAVSDCPNATQQGVGRCYKCGSQGHTTKHCAAKGDAFAFATCFVCGESGHLAVTCPKNDKGIYPKGGSCKFCGSVRHLSKDCKPTTGTQVNELALGTIDLEQGGDDDDVFIALHRIQTSQAESKVPKAKTAPTLNRSAPAPSKSKKVVYF